MSNRGAFRCNVPQRDAGGGQPADCVVTVCARERGRYTVCFSPCTIPLLDEHGDAVEVAEDLELDVARPSCVVPRNKGGEPAHDDFHAVDWFAFMLITASFMICVAALLCAWPQERVMGLRKRGDSTENKTADVFGGMGKILEGSSGEVLSEKSSEGARGRWMDIPVRSFIVLLTTRVSHPAACASSLAMAQVFRLKISKISMSCELGGDVCVESVVRVNSFLGGAAGRGRGGGQDDGNPIRVWLGTGWSTQDDGNLVHIQPGLHTHHQEVYISRYIDRRTDEVVWATMQMSIAQMGRFSGKSRDMGQVTPWLTGHILDLTSLWATGFTRKVFYHTQAPKYCSLRLGHMDTHLRAYATVHCAYVLDPDLPSTFPKSICVRLLVRSSTRNRQTQVHVVEPQHLLCVEHSNTHETLQTVRDSKDGIALTANLTDRP
ncbi:hypothetical protein BKA93DRAFT_749973 [Sparassis latifolia]